MFKTRVRVGFGLPSLDAVKLSHDNAFLLAMCTSELRLVGLQSSTQNGDGESSLSSHGSFGHKKG